jgi:DNA-binding NtrC family response regulator
MSPEIVLLSSDPNLVRHVRHVAGELGFPCTVFPTIAAARANPSTRAVAPRAILYDGPAGDLPMLRRWTESADVPTRVYGFADRGPEPGAAPDASGEGCDCGDARLRRPEAQPEVVALLVHVLGDTMGWVLAEDAGAGLDALVGRSVGFRAVVDAALRLAIDDAPVALIGESGTGKRLFARVLHAEGPRATQAFRPLRCPGLSPAALERELSAARGGLRGPGRGSGAPDEEGGTLYLEDLTALSPESQSELRAHLDAVELARVQGLRASVRDVRLIAGSRVPLGDAVARGQFRADLAERFEGRTIRIPALRERPSDVLLLAEHFLNEFARCAGRPVVRCGDATKQFLTSYRWPGNVRELCGVLEIAFQRAQGASEIGIAHLPAGLQAPASTDVVAAVAGAAARTRVAGAGTSPSYSDGSIVIELPEEGVSFDDLERAILRAALDRTRGNVVRAARLLRLGRGSLRYRLEKHGIMQPKRRRAARRRVVKTSAVAEPLPRAS